MGEILLQEIGEFRGNQFPEIPLPDDVDRAELGNFFVTLPIGRVGARSRNDRVYEAAAINDMVRNINENRPGGQWGHLKTEERSSRYDPPAVRWLAAAVDNEGVVWGKCVPVTQEAINHLRIAKAAKAKVGTSIYGTAVMEGKRVVSLNIETIDLVDPTRVGVELAAALPEITQESVTETTTEKEPEVTVNVAEIEQKLQTAESRVVELTQQLQTAQEAKAELEGARRVLSEGAESFINMGVHVMADGNNLEQVLRQLIEKLQAMSADKLRNAIDGAVTEMVTIPSEPLRLFVRTLVGEAKTEEAAREKITQVLETEQYQNLAKLAAIQESGPKVVTGAPPPQKSDTDAIKDKAVQDSKQIAAEMGVPHMKVN